MAPFKIYIIHFSQIWNKITYPNVTSLYSNPVYGANIFYHILYIAYERKLICTILVIFYECTRMPITAHKRNHKRILLCVYEAICNVFLHIVFSSQAFYPIPVYWHDITEKNKVNEDQKSQELMLLQCQWLQQFYKISPIIYW